MPHGSIHVTRLSDDPQVYAVWFTRYHGGDGPRLHRRCDGLVDLGRLLEALGIRPQQASNALRDAFQKANATLTVDVDERRLQELGLGPA
jgi:hypothetical protein